MLGNTHKGVIKYDSDGEMEMKPNCCIERLRTITQEVSLFSVKKGGEERTSKTKLRF